MQLSKMPVWMDSGSKAPASKKSKKHTHNKQQTQPKPAPGDVRMSLRQQTQMVQAAAEQLRSTPEGQRNDTLNRVVYQLAQYQRDGLDPDLVRDEMTRAAQEAGLEDSEIANTFASAWTSGVGAEEETSAPFDPEVITTVEEIFDRVNDLADLTRDEFAATRRMLKDRFGDALDLKELISAVNRARRSRNAGSSRGRITLTYLDTQQGFFWLKDTKEGPQRVQLTNFTAHITADITEDDGAEKRRMYEVEADCGRGPRRFRLSAPAFANMNWVAEHLGVGAVLFPGISTKEHARAAIQILSGEVPEEQVFAHTGWRELLDGTTVYLHGGGALGADGPVDGVQVQLPDELSRYRLPELVDEPVEAVQASLRILGLVPDTIGMPLLAATFRAPCGTCDFSMFLSGPTGVGKSELAALAQQHFGAEMDRLHLPGAYVSTANSLEATAFQVKDALLTVDDFAPGGSVYDVLKLHQQADRLLRGQGNRQGRQRMRSDGTLRPSKPPRGLILSTGEDVPRGQSLRARMVVLEVGPETLDFDKLTAAQQDAREGLYAACMAGYVSYLAARHPLDHKREVMKLRDQVARADAHRRTPDIIANLAYGMRTFLAYAQEAKAITEEERGVLWDRAWVALLEVGRTQAIHQAASEPVQRFLELLGTALSSGVAHVATSEGNCPYESGAWGWREINDESRPQGKRVGWLDGDNLYLDSDAALVAAQEVGRHLGESLSLSSRTLRKRLSEKDILQTQDAARETLTVRRHLEGRERNVIHLLASVLSDIAKPDIPDTPTEKSTTSTVRRRLRVNLGKG